MVISFTHDECSFSDVNFTSLTWVASCLMLPFCVCVSCKMVHCIIGLLGEVLILADRSFEIETTILNRFKAISRPVVYSATVFPMSYLKPCFLLSSHRFDSPSRCFSIPHILSTIIIAISLSLHLVLLAPINLCTLYIILY